MGHNVPKTKFVELTSSVFGGSPSMSPSVIFLGKVNMSSVCLQFAKLWETEDGINQPGY
jgi:hypothetical protein